jgi:hypothetical protein
LQVKLQHCSIILKPFAHYMLLAYIPCSGVCYQLEEFLVQTEPS